MECGKPAADLDLLRRMAYAGGGYFREKGPVGVSRPVIHAPEMKDLLFAEIDRLQSELEEETRKRLLERLDGMVPFID